MPERTGANEPEIDTMTQHTTPTLAMTPSFRQRALTAAASLVITLAVVGSNLELAQGYADGAHTRTDTAQSCQPVRG